MGCVPGVTEQGADEAAVDAVLDQPRTEYTRDLVAHSPSLL